MRAGGARSHPGLGHGRPQTEGPVRRRGTVSGQLSGRTRLTAARSHSGLGHGSAQTEGPVRRRGPV